MEIRKITTRNIYEVIAEQIKEQIESGKLSPGEKLPSAKELSLRYEVGRSTIREALSALKAMGYIDIRQGEGSTVLQIPDANMPLLDAKVIDSTTVLELLEARKTLELANAGYAATRRTKDDLRQLLELLEHMKAHIGNEAEGEKADLRFHQTLARMTHNSILVDLLHSIATQMERAIRETRRLQMYANKQVSMQLYEEHLAIYLAIEAGDASKATAKMQEHLAHVETVIRKHLPKD